MCTQAVTAAYATGKYQHSDLTGMPMTEEIACGIFLQEYPFIKFSFFSLNTLDVSSTWNLMPMAEIHVKHFFLHEQLHT